MLPIRTMGAKALNLGYIAAILPSMILPSVCGPGF